MKVYIFLVIIFLLSFTIQRESSSNKNTKLKTNKKVKCERKGQYKQYCVDSKDKSKMYNKKVKYNKKFKCLNEAKCEYKDGKCQWFQTTKFKKCLNNQNKK